MIYCANPEDLKNYGTGALFDSDIQRLIDRYQKIIANLGRAVKKQGKVISKIHNEATGAVNGLGTYTTGKGSMPQLLQEKREKAWKLRNKIQREFDERLTYLEGVMKKAETDLESLLRARTREKSEKKKIELYEIGF